MCVTVRPASESAEKLARSRWVPTRQPCLVPREQTLIFDHQIRLRVTVEWRVVVVEVSIELS